MNEEEGKGADSNLLDVLLGGTVGWTVIMNGWEKLATVKWMKSFQRKQDIIDSNSVTGNYSEWVLVNFYGFVEIWYSFS